MHLNKNFHNGDQSLSRQNLSFYNGTLSAMRTSDFFTPQIKLLRVRIVLLSIKIDKNQSKLTTTPYIIVIIDFSEKI